MEKKNLFLEVRKIQSIEKSQRLDRAATLASILRGFCSSKTRMIGHFTDDDRVLEIRKFRRS